MNDCIHYDEELDICKFFTTWGAMPVLHRCEGECFDYDNRKDDDDED